LSNKKSCYSCFTSCFFPQKHRTGFKVRVARPVYWSGIYWQRDRWMAEWQARLVIVDWYLVTRRVWRYQTEN
jgi:hypothetical protein